MGQIDKPMLAGTLEDIGSLKYPILCTPKLDGIRCLVIHGQVLSRNFKPIANNYIRTKLEQLNKDWFFDGELILPDKAFNEISSAVMSEDGEPDFRYVIFDCVFGRDFQKEDLKTLGYLTRMYLLSSADTPEFCKKLFPKEIANEKELLEYEEYCLGLGYEGVMIRSVDGPYKCGRSTNKEGYLLKMKRFLDSEAEITGALEKMHNENEATKDELGRTKRSKHQANMVPADTLGTLLVKDLKSGLEFGIGSGFDDAMRKEIWTNRYQYIGRVVKYKYQPSGMKELPRFPVFLGFRHKDDM